MNSSLAVQLALLLLNGGNALFPLQCQQCRRAWLVQALLIIQHIISTIATANAKPQLGHIASPVAATLAVHLRLAIREPLPIQSRIADRLLNLPKKAIGKREFVGAHPAMEEGNEGGQQAAGQ